MNAYDVLGWSFIAAAILTICAIAAHAAAQRSHERRTDPVTSTGAVRATCDVTGCRYPAVEWRRATSTNGPDELRHLCAGCADEGEAFGWFAAADDIDTIEAFANGEVA